MNRVLTLKWFAVLGIASLFYLLAPRDVSPQMPLYLAMTSAAVIIWTFDLLPAVAVAAALTFLYLLTNMAPPEVVLGPWTTVLIWTTFGAAIFGEAMEKTGLAKRVALRCMLLTGGTFTGMLIGFAIGGIILGLLLASGFARTVIFCAIGEELGMIGCLLALALLTAIIVRCVLVARRAKSPLESYICVGIAAMLIFQTVINVGMCLFLVPVIGLTLPFFSYGGSSIVTLFLAMGMVSGIHKRTAPEWLR